MAMHLAELDGVEPLKPDDPEVVTLRASQLVADLVEPAKSTALEKLGEGRPAFDIANAWLRTKFAVATPPARQRRHDDTIVWRPEQSYEGPSP